MEVLYIRIEWEIIHSILMWKSIVNITILFQFRLDDMWITVPCISMEFHDLGLMVLLVEEVFRWIYPVVTRILVFGRLLDGYTPIICVIFLQDLPEMTSYRYDRV